SSDLQECVFQPFPGAIGFRIRKSAGANEQHQDDQGGKPILALANQQDEKKQQSQQRGQPSAARQRNADAREQNERRVSQKNPQQMPDPSGQRVGQSDRREHFQKTGQVIGANVGARPAFAIALRPDKVPNVLRVGRKLVNGIHRDGHAQKNQHATEQLSRFLPGQVGQNDDEHGCINKDADQFLPGDILNVRL